ncbi:hypothetical protein ULMS_00570 [Patiriisocius marinistellae]|uniref:DUF2383 domain-containing protein n=1 Tax=Patiriisocius marinistellae TaxID=2494560 RepID=A0A5J4FWW8_9FLAO|nr:PA2169 family four-helix-bundle protein [Patiriisocius marinistellae]GEQ84549.1 hypothetical protein ULMS_00570 [Patiriisocius marinistellae]
MKYTEEMSKNLNELLTKNYDAEAGYKKAAEIVDNPKLKRFFEAEAQKRYDFGHELKSEIKNYGENPDKGTSFTGDAHRAWMGMKSAFTSKNEGTILTEVKKGEKATISEYREIINDTTLPPSTATLITKQVTQIENALRNAQNFEVVMA